MTTTIEATGEGLQWKVLKDGELLRAGKAETMDEAKAAADAALSELQGTQSP
jgi:hypothetical protein